MAATATPGRALTPSRVTNPEICPPCDKEKLMPSWTWPRYTETASDEIET